MAVTSSDVTILQSYDIGTRTGKSVGQRIYASVVITTDGASADDIPASAFGLKQITYVQCYGALISSAAAAGVFFVADVGTDDNYIYPVNLEQATDADRNNPADVSGTYNLLIEGIPAA